MEEDFYTVVSYTTSPSLPGTTMWQPQILYSFKAPRGKLDGAARVLQTMVSSVRASLKWYAGYTYVFNLWVKGQMQAINAAGQLSRSIAAGSGSISQSTSDAWRASRTPTTASTASSATRSAASRATRTRSRAGRSSCRTTTATPGSPRAASTRCPTARASTRTSAPPSSGASCKPTR